MEITKGTFNDGYNGWKLKELNITSVEYAIWKKINNVLKEIEEV